MLPNIARFELRYQLRRPIALISFLVFALLGFALGSASATLSSVYANAPISIATSICSLSVVAMFLSISALADVALRDAETRMEGITRTTPVHAAAYLSARFIGAFVIVCFTFLGAALGFAIAV
jgi:hypothetical protein